MVTDDFLAPQVKAATGGRLRLMMNGGAAMSRTTQEFLNTTLATALQGYGEIVLKAWEYEIDTDREHA
jgi:long-chain acyl-CoA synthetase